MDWEAGSNLSIVGATGFASALAKGNKQPMKIAANLPGNSGYVDTEQKGLPPTTNLLEGGGGGGGIDLKHVH